MTACLQRRLQSFEQAKSSNYESTFLKEEKTFYKMVYVKHLGIKPIVRNRVGNLRRWKATFQSGAWHLNLTYNLKPKKLLVFRKG